MGDKLKQSLYFPEDTLREIVKEANRLDRSLSWTVQQAWRLARTEVRKFPSSDRAGMGAVSQPSPGRGQDLGPSRRDDAEDVRPSSQVREFLQGKFDHDLPS